MELKKRKEYMLFTLVFFCIGFVLYGGISIFGRELLGIQWNMILTVLIYGLCGGLLFGGLVSGIILFSYFFKCQKIFVKIMLCIFFPITFLLICLLGILSFIPYEIYNLICIMRDNSEMPIL